MGRPSAEKKTPEAPQAPQGEKTPENTPEKKTPSAPKFDIAALAVLVTQATEKTPIALGDDAEPTPETVAAFVAAVTPIVRPIPEKLRGALVATTLAKVTGTMRKGCVGAALAAVPTGADPGTLVRDYLTTERERFGALVLAAVDAGHLAPQDDFWATVLALVTPDHLSAATERLSKVAAGRSSGDGTRTQRDAWLFGPEPKTLTNATTGAECVTVPGTRTVTVTACPGVVAERVADDPTGKTFALSAAGSAVLWARGAVRPKSGVIACRGPQWWAGFDDAMVPVTETETETEDGASA